MIHERVAQNRVDRVVAIPAAACIRLRSKKDRTAGHPRTGSASQLQNFCSADFRGRACFEPAEAAVGVETRFVLSSPFPSHRAVLSSRAAPWLGAGYSKTANLAYFCRKLWTLCGGALTATPVLTVLS